MNDEGQDDRAASAEPALLAALIDQGDGRANTLLQALAADLHTEGWQVHGLLRSDPDVAGGCARRMVLADVRNGEAFVISQDLGAESTACCLDESGIAAASVALRRAQASAVDLVVVNRFGKLEAVGQGFAAEMLALMADGVPMIVVVGSDHVDAWQHFTGGMAATLPLQPQALRAWCAALPAGAWRAAATSAPVSG